MPVTLALRRQRQESQEFKVNYTVSLRPAWATHYPILEQTKKNTPTLKKNKKITIYTQKAAYSKCNCDVLSSSS